MGRYHQTVELVANSSTTNVSSGNAFVGTPYAITAYASVGVYCYATQSGTLYIEFGVLEADFNGSATTNGTAPVAASQLTVIRRMQATTASTPATFRVATEAAYVRVVWVNTGGSATTTLRLHTVASPDQPNPSTTEATTDVVRAIVRAALPNGSYTDVLAGVTSALDVNVRGPTTSYGQLAVLTETPVAQISFAHGTTSHASRTNTSTNLDTKWVSQTTGNYYYTVTIPPADVISAGGYFLMYSYNITTPDIAIWFHKDGAGSSPGLASTTHVQVNISTGDSAATITTAIIAACGGTVTGGGGGGAPLVISASGVPNLLLVRVVNNSSSPLPRIGAGISSTRSTTSASVVAADALLTLSVSAPTHYNSMQTLRSIRYRPGADVQMRVGAIFSAIPTLSGGAYKAFSFVGLHNALSHCGFGYASDAGTFGILYRFAGLTHVVTFTVTTAASGTETALITAGGYQFVVSLVTAGGSTAHTAHQIERGFNYHGTNWRCYAVGSTFTLYYTSSEAVPNPIDATFTAATAAATGVVVSTGVAALESATYEANVAQADWNVDPMDGTGPSGITLDPSKGNIYQIALQGKGFGTIEFSVLDGLRRVMTPVHRIVSANTLTRTNVLMPAFYGRTITYNTTATETTTLSVSAMGLFMGGGIHHFEPRYSVSNSNNDNALGDKNVHALIILRMTPIFRGKPNHVQATISAMSFTSQSQKTTFSVYINPVFTVNVHYPTYQYVDEADTPMTADAVPDSGGSDHTADLLIDTANSEPPVFKITVASGGSEFINFTTARQESLDLNDSTVLVVAARGYANAAKPACTVAWVEDHP